MQLLNDHHHYREELITPEDRAAVYERYVADLLLSSKVPDSQRESSIVFELKHHHSVAQFARILAKQRRLQEDVCVVGALLHDIHVIVNGTYKNHAHKSAVIASDIIDEIGLFSDTEKADIIKIVYHHSDKDVWSADPYEEICKDADTLDSFLYPNAFGYYLKHKTLPVFKCYIERAKRIWKELNIPLPTDYSVIDNYCDGWLGEEICLDYKKSVKWLAFLMSIIDTPHDLLTPTFSILQKSDDFVFSFNAKNWQDFVVTFKMKYTVQFSLADINMPKEITVAPSLYEKAETMLKELKGRVLIIWSVIKSYEFIPANSDRVTELGIKL